MLVQLVGFLETVLTLGDEMSNQVFQEIGKLFRLRAREDVFVTRSGCNWFAFLAKTDKIGALDLVRLLARMIDPPMEIGTIVIGG